MNKITFKSVVFIAAILGAMSVKAQQAKVFGRPAAANPENGMIRCATTQYEEYLQETYPERQTRTAFESLLQEKIKERRAKKLKSNQADPVMVIPVVVHVIHNGDNVGSNENIADAQVFSQITVLNQDFRRMLNTPGYNTDSVGADVGIEFCMAQVDPYGNPTNGIDRVDLGQESWSNESSIESQVKPATQWDPNNYFNIWVVNFSNSSQLLGYAQFPSMSGLSGLSNYGGAANTDGVVIGAPYFGSSDIYPQGYYFYPYNKGRTATHEIGHCLGLAHIWGDNSSCVVNATDSYKDFCPDTPAAADFNYDCSLVDSCPSSDGYDMVQNYMDYTNDACMNIFTQNQKERMITVMQNALRRASLLNSTVCQAVAGREDFELLNGINIYPNPTHDVINITIGNGELPESYFIYNSLGQTVANVNVNSTTQLSINTAAYSNGIYFIKINKGSQSKTIKFIKN